MFTAERSANLTFSISVHHSSVTGIITIITIIAIRTPRTKHAELYEDDKQEAQLNIFRNEFNRPHRLKRRDSLQLIKCHTFWSRHAVVYLLYITK